MLLPKSDKHFKTRKVEGYQRKVYDKAIALCEEKRVAIDIGAHVGIFTVRMEEDFDEVFVRVEEVGASRSSFMPG